MKQYPRAHLLTGGYDALEKLPRGHRSRAALLKDLAAAICRHGPYAVTTLRNFEDGDLAMIAIAHRRDVDRPSRAITLRIAPPFGGWLSHRSFSFEAEAYARIAACVARSTRRKNAETA